MDTRLFPEPRVYSFPKSQHPVALLKFLFAEQSNMTKTTIKITPLRVTLYLSYVTHYMDWLEPHPNHTEHRY
jgi:hypothetical protein